MKIIAYAVRADEEAAFSRFASELNLEVTTVAKSLSAKNVDLAKGYDGVCFLGNCNIDAEVLGALKIMGIKYLASRSAGYNNVDLISAAANNIRFSNATYSPNCVSDFAIMLILMSIRKVKTMLKRNEAHDFSLAGLQGKEMHNLTFGIIGTGRIGAQTARSLSGFGGKILAYDLYPNKELNTILNYVDLDTLFKQADVITLHAPLTSDTKYLINSESLAKCKEGVVIVNCARAELIDSQALITAIDSGHVGAAALDVFAHEVGIVHHDLRMQLVNNHDLAILQHHKNVIITPHSAFYTDQAVSDMVEVALKSLKAFFDTNESPWEIKN
ncbi:MAG: D-isomer specific 2-hydroxyacid dehydrogenase family protein [Erysipelotrichaceae bacterium]